MINEKVMSCNGEQERRTDFANVRKGDQVYIFGYGDATVLKVEKDHFFAEILKTYQKFCINKNGTHDNGTHQIAFWKNPKFALPLEPKRKTKARKYINIYISNDEKSFQTCGAIHDSKEKAVEKRSKFFKFYQMVSFEVGK